MNYPLVTKDRLGNMIKIQYCEKYETIFSYDSNNNQIYQKDFTGYEIWSKYDNKNNRIYSKHSNGEEYWFDKDGKKIPDPEKRITLTLSEIADKFEIDINYLYVKI